MSDWLRIFITLSITGSGVLIFCWFITLISKETFSAKWHYWNRKLALLLFLIPVFWISEMTSLFSIKNQSNSFFYLPIVYEDALCLTEIFVQIVFLVWLIGVIVIGLRFIYLYRNFHQKLQKNCVPVPKEHGVWSILEQQRSAMNLRNTINLTYCQANISPILVGIFKPTIILPMYVIPDDELAMIIKHELTHHKRRDLWVKIAMTIATILHWYNPFIYVLQKEINKWSEFSCDEDIVMNMSQAERKIYAKTILNTMQRATKDSSNAFLSTSFANGQIQLKRRLMRMLKVKKVSKPIVVLSTVILITFCVVGVVSSAFVNKSQPFVTEKSETTILEFGEPSKESPTKGEYSLYSVKLSDESKFRKEEWVKILEQIENGEVILEE
ncbi:M56 family metallopeptidase [Lysinibacillus sp. NPDC086135]|uniref:M56 family metallopeptidase n=1 Tax=Lysinibacillus sp. NPDC086135 TaxID=3364130 RepID=UPI00382CBFF6